jgi:hypothetical protein
MQRKKKNKTELPTNQVDGKDHTRPAKIPKTIDEVLGITRFSPYESLDEDKYLASLNVLVKIDLQRECVRVGLLPHDNEELMKQRLVKEFRKYIAHLETTDLQPTIVEKTKATEKAAEDIMKRCIFGG